MVEDGRAYYLIPGTLVRVTRDDEAKGMSEILLGGILRPLWTYNRFLTRTPDPRCLGNCRNTGHCWSN
jgi:hypothetical protein